MSIYLAYFKDFSIVFSIFCVFPCQVLSKCHLLTLCTELLLSVIALLPWCESVRTRNIMKLTHHLCFPSSIPQWSVWAPALTQPWYASRKCDEADLKIASWKPLPLYGYWFQTRILMLFSAISVADSGVANTAKDSITVLLCYCLLHHLCASVYVEHCSLDLELQGRDRKLFEFKVIGQNLYLH